MAGLISRTDTADADAIASGHVTTGGIPAVQTVDGSHTVLPARDLSLDRAAAPGVGLDKGGRYDKATDAGALAVLSGTQSHAVPAGVDVSDCGQVYIRCGTFSAPLGIAHLN